jgi:uncharacterized SAM-binding protein YcdF (DUF218 family)
MGFLATKIISAFLLPPLNFLVLGGIGIVLRNRYPRCGHRLILISWLLLYAVSTPLIGRALLQSLENTLPLHLNDAAGMADAIVVLSGDRYCNAPEYGGDTVAAQTLERLRYAAKLHRLTGRPILVTGGKPNGGTVPSGFAMQETLVRDFSVPVKWIEDQSKTTLENARFSAPLLRNQGIRSIYLVTHAAHMPRAVAAFEQAGLQVIPAPTGFTRLCALTPLSFLPSSSGLAMSATAMHEWIGRLWYFLR